MIIEIYANMSKLECDECMWCECGECNLCWNLKTNFPWKVTFINNQRHDNSR